MSFGPMGCCSSWMTGAQLHLMARSVGSLPAVFWMQRSVQR